MVDDAGAKIMFEDAEETSRAPIIVDQHLHVSACKSLIFSTATRM
jgi:hypothetical protein